MREPDQSLREQFHAALSEWAAAQNVLGQVDTYTVSFPAEFDDDPPLDSIAMYESPGGDLGRLQVGLVCLGDIVHRHAIAEIVDIHEQRHSENSSMRAPVEGAAVNWPLMSNPPEHAATRVAATHLCTAVYRDQRKATQTVLPAIGPGRMRRTTCISRGPGSARGTSGTGQGVREAGSPRGVG